MASDSTQLPTSGPGGGASGDVARLLAAGKAKQAVELAKAEHKRLATPESERLLVDAYLARIEQFQQRGAAEDATTLIKLVRERFPGHAARLDGASRRTLALSGDVAALVAPLARADLPPAEREAIEALVREHVTDLPALAAAATLPAEHPLRIAAAAVHAAFVAVTSGPVDDRALELPEVSRRSPLAPWKLLARAIATFHRNDDAACLRALEQVLEGSAPGRAVPAMRAMLDRTKPPSPAAVALAAKVGGDDRPVRAALDALNEACRKLDLRRAKRAMKDALDACRTSHPDLVERLRQHLFAWSVWEQMPGADVRAALGKPVRDAYFWRLMANLWHRDRSPVDAALAWERFLRHAIAEKLIGPRSMEAALVLRRAADALAPVDSHDLHVARYSADRRWDYRTLYADQPPAVAALAPKPKEDVLFAALDVGGLYRRSAEIWPDVETFRRWLRWAQETGYDRLEEDVALAWSRALPKDPEPLLLLADLAEDRNALKTALDRLSAAEALDALNPEVRRARLRLTLATAWRHFKNRKAHLVAADIAALEKLPGMSEGDRPALLGAIRSAWHALRGDPEAARAAAAAVTERLGPAAGALVLKAVGATSKAEEIDGYPLPEPPVITEPRAAAEAQVRATRLFVGLPVKVFYLPEWEPLIRQALEQRPCPLPIGDVMLIGTNAIANGDALTAYEASTAALAAAGTPERLAQALALRGQTLAHFAHRRATQCYRAALELARRAHDPALVELVAAAIDRHGPTRELLAAERGERRGLSADLVNRVVEAERGAPGFPTGGVQGADVHIVPEAVAMPARPKAPEFKVEEVEEEDEDEDDDYDDDAGPGLPPDMPPQVLPLLKKLLKRFGRIPRPDEIARKDPALFLELMTAMGVNPLAEFELGPDDDDLDDDDLDEGGGAGGQGGGGPRRPPPRRPPGPKRR